ncbi:glycoside hydrolase family 9 protein [Dyadobacter flavalbus]|nr:glycoside hydrolase family 9 protein [Dyadobacter flavalbus]
MKNIFCLMLIFQCFSLPVISQDKMLWDGELANSATCTKAYGSILSGPDAYAGNYYFRAEPDNAHSPRISFNCTGLWRSDISSFDELRFFIKSNKANQMTSVRFTTYFAKSNWVNLEPYIQGGGLITTSYKEVRIPLQLLKTQSYNLSSIEFLEFGTSAVSQLQFFIDNIKVADGKSPKVYFRPVAGNIAKLRVSERFDTTDCYNVKNYSIESQADADYKNVVYPVKIGRHAYVSGLMPGSGSPVTTFELFLIFDKPLKNNVSYTIHANKLKDLSDNSTVLDTTFIFSDKDIYGNVKANHVGYLPDSPKLGKLGNFLGDAWFMPIDTLNPPPFQLINDEQQVVFSGNSKFLKTDSTFSGERVFELDFSAFATAGKYHLFVPGYGRSENFTISDNVYDEPYFHTARALYFQRTEKLEGSSAGSWARDGLPSKTAEIHSSHTLSDLNNATDYAPGTKIPMPKGWLDAGDYGRYVPTAASTMFILFTAFELYPKKFPDGFSNIPESDNNIPDLLDELRFETDWLKHMQAPDGGVYFRVTPALWSSGLPGEETNPLYVSEKTTQSTAMFAAAMAMAYRNFKTYDLPYANACLDQAKKAWTFLQAHPAASKPVDVKGIAAGPYPDKEDRDNRAWAAAELYKSTGDEKYHADFLNWYKLIPHEFHATMSWQQHTVKAIWAYSTTTFPVEAAHVNEFKNKLNSEVLVNYFNRTMKKHAYHGAYHHYKGYVGFGSFAMAQSYAFDYIMFSHLLKKPELLDLAKIQLDIPLGNNPLSRSFITGIGQNAPKLPLHWSSLPNRFQEPVPGVPVFGPAATLTMNRPSSFAIQDSANRYPYGYTKDDPYPVLRRYTDVREAVEMAEFTVQEMAVTIASFAFFSSVSNGPLPVRFKNFGARRSECHVELYWATSEETNADYFSVQRSSDGQTFREIGRITASGTTKLSRSYSFTDPQPEQNNYYRLKEVDFDGKYELTRTVFAADPCNGTKVSVSELKNHVFEVKTKTPQNSRYEQLSAEIISKEGRTLKHQELKQNAATLLDASGLPSGIYMLHIRNHSDYPVHTQKIVIY